jgi:tRNA G26 N,N-dimethylase Trm1
MMHDTRHCPREGDLMVCDLSGCTCGRLYLIIDLDPFGSSHRLIDVTRSARQGHAYFQHMSTDGMALVSRL